MLTILPSGVPNDTGRYSGVLVRMASGTTSMVLASARPPKVSRRYCARSAAMNKRRSVILPHWLEVPTDAPTHAPEEALGAWRRVRGRGLGGGESRRYGERRQWSEDRSERQGSIELEWTLAPIRTASTFE